MQYTAKYQYRDIKLKKIMSLIMLGNSVYVFGSVSLQINTYWKIFPLINIHFFFNLKLRTLKTYRINFTLWIIELKLLHLLFQYLIFAHHAMLFKYLPLFITLYPNKPYPYSPFSHKNWIIVCVWKMTFYILFWTKWSTLLCHYIN